MLGLLFYAALLWAAVTAGLIDVLLLVVIAERAGVLHGRDTGSQAVRSLERDLLEQVSTKRAAALAP